MGIPPHLFLAYLANVKTPTILLLVILQHVGLLNNQLYLIVVDIFILHFVTTDLYLIVKYAAYDKHTGEYE